MPDQTPPIPLDLSGHRDLPTPEIAPLLEKVGATPEDRALSALTALLMNRALRILRQGSRQEILDESLMLNRFLAIQAGERLKVNRPEVFGGWTALGQLLSGAARSASRAAVPSILSGTRGRDVLELLASERRRFSRSEIKNRLKFKSESHLSHLLRDLEEADLVIRYRPEKGKEVAVELGPVGREVVEQSVLPPWLERLACFVGDVASGRPADPETIARELEDAGAPSRLAARKLAEALAAGKKIAIDMPVAETPSRGKVLQFTSKVAAIKNDENHFEIMLDRQGEQRPGALFEVEEEALATV